MEHYEELVEEVTKRVLKCLENNKSNIKVGDQPESKVNSLSYAIIGDKPVDKKILNSPNYKSVLPHKKELSDILLITSIDLYTVVRIANILATNDTEEIILNHLLGNKKVVILSETVEQMNRIENNRIKSTLKKHLTTLKQMGVAFKSHSQLDDYLANQQTDNYQPISKQRKRNLLTLDSVMSRQVGPGDVLEVENNTIITALAVDYLKEKQVKILRRDS